MIQKIINLFASINCPALFVLKTPRAGQEVDNGMGVDFDLAPYAVIHKGSILEEEQYKVLYEFERNNNTDLQEFDSEGCNELKEIDGYEIVLLED
jgi:hypothetical protein